MFIGIDKRSEIQRGGSQMSTVAGLESSIREIKAKKIHHSAVIDPRAEIHESVVIGPFCLVEKGVVIGEGCELVSHVVIKGDTTIGKNNRFYQFATIGEDPPDKKYGGECTKLLIGDNNVFREAVTVHTGTIQDEAKTVIGSNNLFLAYVHIAHDCQVGDNTVFANNASLAGHVKVGNNVNFGGFSKVSQYCKIGDYAFICADATITKDVPAYLKIAPSPARPAGLNTVGMERAGISKESKALIKEAYQIVYQKKNPLKDALLMLRERLKDSQSADLKTFIASIEGSERGVIR